MDKQKVLEAKTYDEARQCAIDWQIWTGESEDMSYGELIEWQNVFVELAERFDGLGAEFMQEGII